MNRVTGILCLLILALFVIGTQRRNKVWTDELALYEDIARKSPEKPQVQANLGVAYRNRGLLSKAIAQFEKADRLHQQRKAWDQVANAKHVGAIALSNIAAIHLDYGGPALWGKADQLLEQARNTYPPDEFVLANSIEVMIRLGEWERAANLLEAAMKEVQNSAMLNIQGAELAAVNGRCDIRDAYLHKAETIDPFIRIDGGMRVRECKALESGGF